MSDQNWLQNLYRGFSDRDLAQFLIEGLNLESQLIAIRSVLSRNEKAEAGYWQAAKLLEEHAAAEEGEYGHHLTDRWVDHMHQGVYLDAAHSMSAVAMLAPFIESLFSAVFREIRRREEKERPPAAMDKRTRLSRDLLWNPHLVLNAREVNDDLVKGIEELA